ncbi:MAG: GGDEF domain-containing protein, partial [Candidatus Dormibacteria bacterium]
MTPAPLRRKGLAARLVPLLAAGALTALVRIGPSPSTVTRAQLGVLLLVAFLPVASFVIPWGRLPRWLQAVPPLLAMPVFILPLLGSAETRLTYSPILLLPILILGLYYTGLELGLGILVAALVTVGPPLVTGAAAGDIFLSTVYAIATTIAGFSVHVVTRNIRRHDTTTTNVAKLLREVSAAEDPEVARRLVCEGVMRATGAAVVLLLEGDPTGLWLTSTSPPPDVMEPRDNPLVGPANRLPTDLAESSRAAVDSRLPVLVNGAPLAGVPGCEKMRSAIFQPLLQANDRPCVLVAGWPWGIRISGSEASTLALVAPEAALVLEHVYLVARLAQLAMSDTLTTLPNRLVWQEQVPRMLARSRRLKEPICAVALDLDHFKAYNDDWGHQHGDELLRRVATACRGALRDADLLVRFGGDEFGALLPGCTLEGAQVVIERLRDVMPEGQTYSAGISWWDEQESATELLARADAALYECKRSGRGHVMTADIASSEVNLVQWTKLIPELVER